MAPNPQVVATRRAWLAVALGFVLGLPVVVVMPPLAVVLALTLAVLGFLGRHSDPAHSRDLLAAACGLLVVLGLVAISAVVTR
ncbi:MAG TPA: hypothetical protein VN781_07845 [Acidimicrobiales bacterium]|nr:hypothetical protein [Acidimicrobiales bacterium]